jgi:predicted nucleic acid-binding protein
VNALVVDASVAAKWFLPSNDEPLSGEALALLGRFSDGEIRFIVPDLFWPELGNVLWKAVRKGRCRRESAESAISLLTQQNILTISSTTLITEAFAIATTFDRPVYDSLYVAAALASKAQLVTADERLANALAARLPVKWLGAL